MIHRDADEIKGLVSICSDTHKFLEKINKYDIKASVGTAK